MTGSLPESGCAVGGLSSAGEKIRSQSGRTADARTQRDASECTGLLPTDAVAVCRRTSGSTGGSCIRMRDSTGDRKKQFGQQKKLRK